MVTADDARMGKQMKTPSPDQIIQDSYEGVLPVLFLIPVVIAAAAILKLFGVW
jgi:hypothetical protein